MKINRLYFLMLLFAGVLVSGCSDDDDNEPEYQVPDTYTFENVAYDGQLTRLAMLSELKSYMATSQTMGVALDADKMKAMYANDASKAGWSQTYDETKQLKSKTFAQEQEVFDALFDELAAASQSTLVGSEGVSGVIESNDGAKSYLVGEDGLDHAQLIEKGLMGACLYYQATSVYFGADRMNVDNETVVPGEGTEMEHHWDEAFGYLGVPVAFPTSTDGVIFWGDYAVKRESVLNNSQALMDAMIEGRAAISNDDLATRDEAIAAARKEWELVSVGSALHYLNVAIDNFDDMAIFSHGLSEGIAFTYSLKFNEAKTINNTQIDELLVLMGGADTFDKMNLYNVTVEDLQSAKDQLAAYYGLEDKKDAF
ncbi:MAG: DUF4856 domain-containing protein [Saprospiraceae bacterium]|nr:DUF4856 domain-containing protein [Saprospiraceae bacterium]